MAALERLHHLHRVLYNAALEERIEAYRTARISKKALAERVHQCGCGFAATRDQAAALAMLAAGLRFTGREPTWARASEPETVHQSREAA